MLDEYLANQKFQSRPGANYRSEPSPKIHAMAGYFRAAAV
jgi:hypothetical protein